MKYVLAIVFLGSIFAFTKVGPWPKEVEKAYMKSCVDSATESGDLSKKYAKKFCGCSMRKLQALYPDATKMGNLSEDIIQKVVSECVNNQ